MKEVRKVEETSRPENETGKLEEDNYGRKIGTNKKNANETNHSGI